MKGELLNWASDRSEEDVLEHMSTTLKNLPNMHNVCATVLEGMLLNTLKQTPMTRKLELMEDLLMFAKSQSSKRRGLLGNHPVSQSYSNFLSFKDILSKSMCHEAKGRKLRSNYCYFTMCNSIAVHMIVPFKGRWGNCY